MIPVKQRKANDCVRAAVASLLERPYEEVPNFAARAEESGQWWGSQIDYWLWSEGYAFKLGNFAFHRPITGHISMESFFLGRPWWFATVVSKVYADSLHAVVMQGNEVAWDPGLYADEPEYRAKPYTFVFANFFYVPDPHAAYRSFHR